MHLKRIAGLCLLLLILSLSAQAHRSPELGLRYVAADSVVVWGEGYSDLRGMALGVDTALRETATLLPYSKRLQKDWLKHVVPQLALSGCRGGNDPIQTAVTDLAKAKTLFAATGQAQFMDAAERLLFNVLLREVVASGPGSFDKHTAAQALVDGTGCIYATDGDGLWINLFINSTTHVKTADFSLVVDQMTDMPFSGRVKVRLTGMPRNGFPLKVRLRMPGWATGQLVPAGKYTYLSTPPVAPTVYINGREGLNTAVDGGYVIVSRAWNRGDEILIDFPLSPCLVSHTVDGGSRTDIVRGPLFYTVADSCAQDNASIAGPLSETRDAADLPLVTGRYADGRVFTAWPYFLSGSE